MQKGFTQPIKPKISVVLVKCQKLYKKRSKNKKFDDSEGHKFMCKKNGRSHSCRDFFQTVLLIETKNLDLRMLLFENTKKNQKYGSNFPLQTFSKAVDRGVK